MTIALSVSKLEPSVLNKAFMPMPEPVISTTDKVLPAYDESSFNA